MMKCSGIKKKEQGMTLVEVVVTLGISMLVLGMLGTVLVTVIRVDSSAQSSKDTLYALQQMRQFIEEECRLAETICIDVYPTAVIDDTHQSLDMAHPSHNEPHQVVPKEVRFHVKQMVFDAGKYDSVEGGQATSLVRGIDAATKETTLRFQGCLLQEGLTSWTVVAYENGTYMTVGLGGEETTFRIPLEYKAERGGLWQIK